MSMQLLSSPWTQPKTVAGSIFLASVPETPEPKTKKGKNMSHGLLTKWPSMKLVISAGDGVQCCWDPKLPGVKEKNTKLCSITYRNKGTCKVDLQGGPRGCLRYYRVKQQWGVWYITYLRRRMIYKRMALLSPLQVYSTGAKPNQQALLLAGKVLIFVSAMSVLTSH